MSEGMNKHLPQHWIDRTGRDDKALLKWPPRSPDMTPCDFIFWGFMKDKVFVAPLPLDFMEIHLGHIGLYARRPIRVVPLTSTHCHVRLNWSREHTLWTPQQWSCVMFCDESRFNLQSDSLRTLIWRGPGTRYHQDNAIERHRYGGAVWLVWGGIILVSRTVPACSECAEFLFKDDNARPHRANIVHECLQSEDITLMHRPAYSLDFNSIEHVWDMLGRRIAALQPPPTCLPELRKTLLDEWCNIVQDQIDNLILSMPRHYTPPHRVYKRLAKRKRLFLQTYVYVFPKTASSQASCNVYSPDSKSLPFGKPQLIERWSGDLLNFLMIAGSALVPVMAVFRSEGDQETTCNQIVCNLDTLDLHLDR
ncbi:transposable element Tcb1 transposase [Trichonephila clavipes]|nr:transposable element Tcb1 transposase [Trichonephila clavipes]